MSQKIKDSRRQYAGRGQCVNAYPIYGYVKSPEDRRTWIIEPESAQVVRQIFDLFLSGKGQTDIAKILNAEGIPTPSQHQRSLGSKRQLWNSQRMQNEWAHTTIARLLRDERYTGTLIALKTSVTEVGNMNSAKPLDKSEQVRIPGTREGHHFLRRESQASGTGQESSCADIPSDCLAHRNEKGRNSRPYMGQHRFSEKDDLCPKECIAWA